MVLTGEGLMVRTYRALLRLDIGYNTHDVLTCAALSLRGDKYPTGEKITMFYRELTGSLNSLPGIDGAAVATGRPFMD